MEEVPLGGGRPTRLQGQTALKGTVTCGCSCCSWRLLQGVSRRDGWGACPSGRNAGDLAGRGDEGLVFQPQAGHVQPR